MKNPPPLYEKAIRLIAQKGWRYSQHTNGLEDQRAITAEWEKVNETTPIAKLRWDLDHDVGIDVETLNRLKDMGAGVTPSGGVFGYSGPITGASTDNSRERNSVRIWKRWRQRCAPAAMAAHVLHRNGKE